MRLLKLTESNLNRIVHGHETDGYIMVSASRTNYTEEENNVRTKNLRKWLRGQHYSYIAVYGGYKEAGNQSKIEKSFIVYPFDIVTKGAVDWDSFESALIDKANELEQETLLICPPHGKPYYKGISDDELTSEPFSLVKINDVVQEYFTALKKWSDMSLNKKDNSWNNGNPQRFTFESFDDDADSIELYLEPYPTTIMFSHKRLLDRNMNNIYLNMDEYEDMFDIDSFIEV